MQSGQELPGDAPDGNCSPGKACVKCCEFIPLPLQWRADGGGWERAQEPSEEDADAEKCNSDDTAKSREAMNVKSSSIDAEVGQSRSQEQSPQLSATASKGDVSLKRDIQFVACYVTPVHSVQSATTRRRKYQLGEKKKVLFPRGCSQLQALHAVRTAFAIDGDEAARGRGQPSKEAAQGRLFTDCGYEIETGAAELITGDSLYYTVDGIDLPSLGGDGLVVTDVEDDGTTGPRASAAKDAVVPVAKSSPGSSLPVMFQYALLKPTWFRGFEYELEGTLISILQFLVPSQDLPRLAAVDHFLHRFVKQHMGQLSIDWLRLKLGGPVLGSRKPIPDSVRIDEIARAHRAQPPRLQYVSFLDGTVFDTDLLNKPRSMHSKNRGPSTSANDHALDPWTEATDSGTGAEEWTSAELAVTHDSASLELNLGEEHKSVSLEPRRDVSPDGFDKPEGSIITPRPQPQSAALTARRRVVKLE